MSGSCAFMQTTRGDKNFQIARSGWMGDYNDPMTMLELYLSYAPSNPGYNNPEYDKLIESSKHIVNPKDRMSVLHNAESILMYDMPIIPIHYRSNVLMVDKNTFFVSIISYIANL